MDLDDDELEATRKLNGVDKERDIEKDIKRCEELIKPEHANWIGISNQLAIAGVLARIKELEEKKKNSADFQQKYIEVTNLYLNSIPKQKVKNKIEELNKKEQELQNSITEEEREEYSDANISFLLCDIEIKREILKELLENKQYGENNEIYS